MPVVLASQERVKKWLDCDVPFESCIPLLSPYKENCLSWYKVSEYVGSTRNQKVITANSVVETSYLLFMESYTLFGRCNV
mmetsp:Transcript_25327/g.35305  ORF Transcript_25327/g.35305 Transcript_25327/m.35305 type:complete len:80 (+) Transcript_25327:842-1081(+)